MDDELVRSLRICAEGEHCDKCTKWEAKQNGGLNVCLTALCKEAADVRPVVTCADCKHNNACLTQAFVEDASRVPFDRNTFPAAWETD